MWRPDGEADEIVTRLGDDLGPWPASTKAVGVSDADLQEGVECV